MIIMIIISMFVAVIIIIIIIIIIIKNKGDTSNNCSDCKSLRKYVSDKPGQHDFKELQKTTILGTAHIFRKVLT